MSDESRPPELPGEVWRERDDRKGRWLALALGHGGAAHVRAWYDREGKWGEMFSPSQRILTAWAMAERAEKGMALALAKAAQEREREALRELDAFRAVARVIP